MYKLVVLLCMLCALLAPAYTVQDDRSTLIDDEDSASTTQVGMFALELSSNFGCNDWLESNREAKMRNDILAALVQAVYTYCQCDFTRDYIEQITTSCSENSRNIMYMNGEIRITDSPHEKNMSTLLRGVEQWAGSGPTFNFPLELGFDMSASITVSGASTGMDVNQDASGSGSGDYTTTDSIPMATPTTNAVTTESTVTESETTTYEPTTTVMSANTADSIIDVNSFQPMKMSIMTTVAIVLCSCLCSFF